MSHPSPEQLYIEQLCSCIRDLLAVSRPRTWWWRRTWRDRVERAQTLLRRKDKLVSAPPHTVADLQLLHRALYKAAAALPVLLNLSRYVEVQGGVPAFEHTVADLNQALAECERFVTGVREG
jgi:hypothetical protein